MMHSAFLRYSFAGLLGGSILYFAVQPETGLAQPGMKKVREEEEEEPKEKIKVPKKIEDKADPKEKEKEEERPRPVLPGGFNIAAEAVNKSRPLVIRNFLNRLAIPYDLLQSSAGKSYKIALYPQRSLPAEKFTYFELNASLLNGKERELASGAGFVVQSYEEIVLEEVEGFLKRKYDGVTAADQTELAIQILTATRRLHDSWVQQQKRVGKDWIKVDDKLKNRVVALRRDQLRGYVAAKDWRRADELVLDLSTTFPDEPEVKRDIDRLLLMKADQSLQPDKIEDYSNLFQALVSFEQNPGAKGDALALAVRKKLTDRAKALVNQAKGLTEKNQTAAAFQLLRVAESLDPELTDIGEMRTRWKDRILYVGVPQLPERLSPATARTDSERWAVELLFESLMKVVPDAELGRRYIPCLASGMPSQAPLARDFPLTRNIRWCGDGGKEYLDARDIQGTLSLLKNIPDRWSAEGLDVFDLRELRRDELFRMRLSFSQGVFEPLSRTTFKVLPARYFQRNNKSADDDAFAREPFGSGPFKYDGREKEGNREVAVFRANPYYGQRPGKFGQPTVREIRFFVPTQSTISADLAAGQVHMVLDVPTNDIPMYRDDPAGRNVLKVHTATQNRRIHILAVNHRRVPLQNADLRRGLSAAIDREEILKEVYRPEWARNAHRAMTGPFPLTSWATPPKAKEIPLFNPALAGGLLGNAAKASTIRLNLRYASDDASASRVAQLLKEQIEKNAGQVGGRPAIEIQPDGLDSPTLRRRVEIEHDYDLALYSFDYRDDQFRLDGWLDGSAAGRHGRNFLGYLAEGSGATVDDQRIRQTLDEIRSHRDFRDRLREKMWDLHRLCNARMPFIPLWQLDRNIVVHQNLEFFFDDLGTPIPPTMLDPTTIFTGVELWRMK